MISLRKKDLSADTLEEFGIDVTYMARHKFDPATFPALLKVLREKRADIVHMHGYGATTFGRLCAWRMGIPAILHEHANHGDTPWFQKIADRLLAPHTDLAIAVSESTGEFTTRARLMPAERTKVVYLGAPLDEFARPRTRTRSPRRAAALGIAPGTDGDRHDHAPDAVEGQSVPDRSRAARAGRASRTRASSSSAKASCKPSSRRRRARSRLGDRLVFSGFTRDVAAALSALDIVVFPSLWEGTPLTVFEALAMGKPIVATDADGLLDVLTDRKDALVVPKAQRRGAGRRRSRR